MTDRELGERRAEGDGRAFESALRRILTDDELVRAFWHRGFVELSSHAGNGASQWIGKRIITALVVSVVTAGVVWLVKSGALK